jgi:hypothetical protein
MKMEDRLIGRIALSVSFSLFLLVIALPIVSAEEPMEIKYEFVCTNNDFGLSAPVQHILDSTPI